MHQRRLNSPYISEYVKLRLKNITMHDASDPEAIEVTVDTLKLLHLNGASTLDDRSSHAVVGKNVRILLVTGFFPTSERDTHVHVPCMDLFNHHVPPILDPKGYKMINTFDYVCWFCGMKRYAV
jgi:hypothetical protein